MNAPASEEIMRQVAAQTEAALEKVLSLASDDLRVQLGVPVNRSTRPPTRSKPGEYPRKDSGRLQESVTHVVYRAGNYRVRGVVATNTPYAEYVNATRPYKALFEAKWKREVEVRLSYSLRP